MAEPRMGILLDPGDDVAITRGLMACHNPGAGVVVVHPTPAVRDLVSLGQDVLAALGGPVNTFGEERMSRGAKTIWRAAAAWLRADGIEQLVVLRAHRLQLNSWLALTGLLSATRVRLLLVCH